MRKRIQSQSASETAVITRSAHPAVTEWIRNLRASDGHEPLYAGFEYLRRILRSPDTGEDGLVAHYVFTALAYEVSYVLRSYKRQHSLDVFSLHAQGARYGTYELQSSRHFIGDCGGPHEERVFVVAQGWRQYLQRCLDLLWLLLEEQLMVVAWPEKGLSQQESEWLCEPLTPRYIEGHRGCWRSHFVSSLDEKRVSGLLRETGFLLSVAEERHLDSNPYPPEESIFGNPDDDIFSNLLRGAAKTRSAFARIALSRLRTDDEDWVRKLANQLLNEAR